MVARGPRAAAQPAALPAPYPVVVEHGALARLAGVAAEAAPAHRYAVITDANVGPRYADRARAALGHARTTVYEMPAGETEKTRDRWARLTDAMLHDGFGRDSAVIALGGGVVGDLAGFVAATYMRGIPVVQVPTTLVAMIDSAFGGKTGVDTAAGKNLVGAFHQPAAVLVDPELLDTLPREHLRAGLAEALKHGVIRDAAYFDRVADAAPRLAERGVHGIDAARLADLVLGSIGIKLAVVASDERENGLRKILNFGHTIGHAIERVSNYTMLHGETVAIGMVLESALAERLGVAAPGTADAVASAVRAARLPDARPAAMSPAALLEAMRLDKKVRAGRTELALPRRVGAMGGADSGWAIPVDDANLLEILR